jgi:hypothetical protein
MKRWSAILLGVWLIAGALLPLLRIHIPGSGIALAALGIAAGVVIVLEGNVVKIPGNLGILLLAVWLVLAGAMKLLNFAFPYSAMVLPALAVIAGILIIVQR